MNTVTFISKLRWVVLLMTTILYFVQTFEGSDEDDTSTADGGIIHDMFTLEKWFRDFHPNLKNISFPLTKQLTAEKHVSLCQQILSQITPPDEDINKHVYVTPEPATIRKSRIIRGAPLYFQRMGVEYVPVIVCTYEDMKLYLVNANNTHMFQLNRDQDNIFTFKSGLHPINITIDE